MLFLKLSQEFSYWKHYREFQNIFAFKPLIEFNKNTFNLTKILPIKTVEISKSKLRFDNKYLNKIKKKMFFTI